MKELGRRAIGYCKNPECLDFHKGKFLLEPPKRFYCPVCKHYGIYKRSTFEKVNKGYEFYRAAVLNFNYNVVENRYMEQAIVELDQAVGGNVLVIEDPLIKTEKRALHVAEAKLAAINAGDGDIDGFQEIVLNFNAPDDQWHDALVRLGDRGQEIHRRLYGDS